MKKMSLLVGVLFLLAFSVSEVPADPISVGDTIYVYQGIGGANNGGSFIVEKPNGTPLFVTFCVETNEYFNPGYALKVDGLSTLAKLNGSDTTRGYDPSLGGDPLDTETAYLYYHFRKGDLGTLTGGTFVYGQAASYNALQAAIWWIEQEINGSNNYLVALAAANANGSLYGVQVMNLTENGNRAQDMLTVPEPGILILLGIAMSTIGAASWRLRKL